MLASPFTSFARYPRLCFCVPVSQHGYAFWEFCASAPRDVICASRQGLGVRRHGRGQVEEGWGTCA
eukprot:7147698-Lingulodinium_polyedra.AAC.1